MKLLLLPATLVLVSLNLPVHGAPDHTELGKGKRISVNREDFNLEMERVPKEKQYEFLTDPLRIERTLATMARTKTYAAIARERGLTESAEYKSRIRAEEERILARMLLNQLASEVKVPDLTTRARELYLANPEQSTEPEQMRASHIMISLRGRTREETAEKLAAIREEVVKDPKRFGEIAAEKSEDETARQNKGDMGLLPRGRLAPDVEAVLFGMKEVGEISQIVQGPSGLHIVQVHEIVPKRKKPFSEVEAEFKARAERAYVEAELFKLQEQWLREENFKLKESAIESLMTRFEPNSLIPAKSQQPATGSK